MFMEVHTPEKRPFEKAWSLKSICSIADEPALKPSLRTLARTTVEGRDYNISRHHMNIRDAG